MLARQLIAVQQQQSCCMLAACMVPSSLVLLAVDPVSLSSTTAPFCALVADVLLQSMLYELSLADAIGIKSRDAEPDYQEGVDTGHATAE